MATYVNDLRLKEIATGDESGTWGTSTNTSLELIGEALGYATQQVFGSDADATTTIADGASDPARAMYFKITSAGSLTATRTCTIAPNTVSRVMFIENATTGSQSIAISQGSGANVTIATGKTAVVYLDGAGSGAAVVDAMLGVDPGVTDTLTEVLVAGNTTGGTDLAVSTGDDITFADSSKAIFGAGSDLQIYHDGGNSRIYDQGTGALVVRSNQLNIQSPTGEKLALFNQDSDVELYYDDSLKLATTATGIDVTGTVTADGLTVDGDASISSANVRLRLFETDTTDLNTQLQNQAGDFFIKTIPDDASTSTNRFAIDHATGDISFYEDTGTTPKFFWDASAESLGIGTSSPSQLLELSGATAPAIRLNDTTYNQYAEISTANAGSLILKADVGNGGTGDTYIGFEVDATERMRINTSGNVGIGTDSPSRALEVYGATAGVIAITSNSTDGVSSLSFGDTADDNAGRVNYLNASDDMLFYTATAERMRIEASGNVGIGTSSPSEELEIASSSPTIQLTDTNDSTFGKLSYNVGALFLSSNQTIRISTADTERMRIDASGNVGIGTSSPQQVLQISQGASAGTTALRIENTETGIDAAQVANAIEFYTNDASTGGTGVTGKISHVAINAGTTYALAFSSYNGTTLSEAMRIYSNGNVGIGQAIPKTVLNASASTGAILTLESSDTTLTTNNVIGQIDFYANDSSTNGTGAKVNIKAIATSTAGTVTALTFGTSDSASATAVEAMRIDGSGNFLVGKTANDYTTAGVMIEGDGTVSSVKNGVTGLFNRLTTDGEILQFRKDGSTVGSIGVVSGNNLNIFSAVSGHSGLSFGTGIIFPTDNAGDATDGITDLGSGSYRFDNIFATNGTIQTSDRNEKQDIAELSDAEQRVAVATKGLLRKFRWKSSVAEKGDEARTHFGIIAQDLQAAFEAEGLDAGDYAMFINSTWTDEETGEERSRMGVRYAELLAFIIAAI